MTRPGRSPGRRHWRFQHEVPEEVESSARWYEDQRAGLGDEFLQELDETIAQLEEGSLVPARTPEDARAQRVLLRRFPFAVVFVEVDDEHVIVAVAHLRRRPGYWRDRELR